MKKYTKQDVENRTSDDICHECGQQFLDYLPEEVLKRRSNIYTAWTGVCGLCGEETSVTDMRHYNYLRIPE